MITNIILGIILVAILVIFFILNNKINDVLSDIKFIKGYLKSIDNTYCTSNKLMYNLLDKLNDFISCYKSNNNTIKETLTKIDEGNEVIFNKVNGIDSDIQNLIIAEHILTRKQIEKQAKISSKIVSRKKQGNNTQK